MVERDSRIRGPNNKPPSLITTSQIREAIARSCGWCNVLNLNIHSDAEDSIKNSIGEGNITPMRLSKDRPLIPLEISAAKAEAVIEYFENKGQEPPPFFVVDSVWGIRFPDGNTVLVHKPSNEEDIKQTACLFYQAAQAEAEMQSISGVTAVRDKKYYPYLITVTYGKINTNADWGSFEQRLRENNHKAGGISSFDLFNGLNLVSFNNNRINNNRILIQFETFSGEGKNIIARQVLSLSNDASNYLNIAALSVGILPPY